MLGHINQLRLIYTVLFLGYTHDLDLVTPVESRGA